MKPSSSPLLCVGLVLFSVGAAQYDRARAPHEPDQGTALGVAIPSLPFTIEKCGVYFLAGCLFGSRGEAGIRIEANDVTLDLNGFTLQGVPGSLDGILVAGPLNNVTILNGTVRGWGGSGIEAGQLADGHFRDLHLVENSLSGLGAGFNPIVTRCTARSNGQAGISSSDNGVFTSCNAWGNGFSGLLPGEGSSLRDCTSRLNQDGISAGSRSVLSNCTAASNERFGFAVSAGTLSGCVATENGSSGFVSGGMTTITGCTATLNGGDGMAIGGRSLVQGNLCAQNRSGNPASPAAGIRCTSFDARVEGNNASINDVGIAVTTTGCLVIGNSASGNSIEAYAIAPGNSVGQILDVTDAGAFANADPTANFVH